MMGILAVDTLESMDWCLEKLEHLQTNRAVADMAADKFKMLLDRELSVMSQSSNEGRNISKHFTDTYCGKYNIGLGTRGGKNVFLSLWFKSFFCLLF